MSTARIFDLGIFVHSKRLNQRTLNLIFIPALILLLFVSFFLYHQFKTLVKANEWVLHTHVVIQKTESILYELIDIESHQRGYLITGDSEYLAKLDANKLMLMKMLDELTALIKNNPEQTKRVLNFTNLIHTRLRALDRVAQLKMENKLNTPFGINLFQRNQEISSQVKGLGQEIKSVEFVLLKERNEAAVTKVAHAKVILIVSGATSLLFLLIAFILINSELFMRNLTEEKHKKSRIQLRNIIEGATDMIAAFDENDCFIIFNQPYEREFKYLFKKTPIVGVCLHELLEGIAQDKKDIAALWQNSLLMHESSQSITLPGVGDEKIVYEMTVSPMQNEEGEVESEGKNRVEGTVQIVRNISKRVNQHLELQKSYESLAQGMVKLQEKNEQISLLVEMSDILLACSSQEELSHVMAKYAARMLQFASGYLYVMHPSKNYLEMITSWNSKGSQQVTFIPEQCWAIRRGRIHLVNINHKELLCEHLTPTDKPYILMCVPLMAQNDIYGLLHMELAAEEQEHIEEHKLLINAFSELTALALANVRLRENLRHQSIRDPLTNLYNRRYLEDFLFKQLRQAELKAEVLSVLMLDLDHFKKLNDNYGHDAGDTALKEFGRILQNNIGHNDLASRYGGEEFVVVLSHSDSTRAKSCADMIRDEFSKAKLLYGAQVIGPLSVSIGIAQFPADGKTTESLLESADRALYCAKNQGRDRAVFFSELDDSANDKSLLSN